MGSQKVGHNPANFTHSDSPRSKVLNAMFQFQNKLFKCPESLSFLLSSLEKIGRQGINCHSNSVAALYPLLDH